MQKIYSTKNYDLFESYYANRDLFTDDIIKSMRKHGWIDAYPMHVTKNGGKALKIKDGHHRFAAARTLGIPIKYTVCEDDATIPELEKTKRIYSLNDYLGMFVRMGKKEYIHLKNYHVQTGIPLSICIALHMGWARGNKSSKLAFTSGNFIIKNLELPRVVGDVVLFCKKQGHNFASEQGFAVAVAKVGMIKNVSIRTLKTKISQSSRLMQKQYSIENYMQMLEKIYNNRNKIKLPIVFLADQISKDRQGHK